MSEPLNPYAPPREPEATEVPRAQRSKPVVALYESAAGKAWFAQVATAVTLLLRIALAGSLMMLLTTLHEARRTDNVDPTGEIATQYSRQSALGSFVTLSSVVTFVALLVWIHAVYSNLEAFGARNLNSSAGWAVGSFFIPIANFWKPYQALVEVWSHSDPAVERGWSARPPALLTWWWVLWALVAIASRFLIWRATRSQTFDEFINLSTAMVVVIAGLEAPMLVCQFLFIRKLQRFQDEHHELLLLELTAQRVESAGGLPSIFRQ